MFAENLVSVTESENFPAVKKKGREKGEKRELCGREGHFFPVDRISEKGQKWPSPGSYSVSNLSQSFSAASDCSSNRVWVCPHSVFFASNTSRTFFSVLWLELFD